jgi:hypothetical protein
MRDLLINDRVYGYGIHNEDLPCEDYWERLIDNGVATPENPVCRHTFESGDPYVQPEDIQKVKDTRWFIDVFLDEELDGDELDFTSYPDPML